MAYTEFYCQTTGSNLNSGSTTADTAAFTYTSSLVLGWSSVTGVFEVATGNPSSDGVAVGDFASVYVTSGATVATFVSRVTARDTTSITVSLTAKSGTAPTTDALGATTMKVGGAWKGPNAAVSFPFGFIANTLTSSAGDFPRVNFKSGTTYSITAAMTHANTGPIRFQGYTTTPGDGGRATIDGGTSGASYVLLTVSSAATIHSESLIFQNNGATGSATGVNFTASGATATVRRCVFNNLRGNGLEFSGANALCTAIECEAYACNQSNSANKGALTNNNNAVSEFVGCISHDNAGSNNAGFWGASLTCINCIADTNGGVGFSIIGGAGVKLVLLNCDAYNNGSDGALNNATTGAPPFVIANSNFIKNAGWGINGSTTGGQNGSIINCGFGSGNQANTSGTTTNLRAASVENSVTYASDVTPWIDPANGDFRIALGAAKNAGRGAFTQTAASYAGTIGYPDIGSAQHLETGGSAIPSIAS